MRRLFATVAIAASLIAGAASAQTSVILRKPDNSAAVDPATAGNQASANGKLDQIHTDLTGATPAGSNVIGKVGLDQSTPGTTNGVVVNSSALPSGAATASNQVTANGSLSSLDGKTPSLGQATKAGSAPVVLPSDPDYRPSASTITAADSATATLSGQSSVSLVTGTPTVNSALTWPLNGHSSATLTVTGTFSGTLNIEETADGGTYGPAGGKILGAALTTKTITAPGVFRVDATGMSNIRVRASAWASGSATVQLAASGSSGLTQVINPITIVDSAGNPASFTTGQQISSLSSPVVIASDQLGTINAPPTGNIFTVQGPCPRGTSCTPAPLIIGGWSTSTGTTNPCQIAESGGDYSNTVVCGAAMAAQCRDTLPAVQTEQKWGWVRFGCRNHNLIVDLLDDGANVWNYAGTGVTNTTTAVTLIAANATRKNCVSSVDISWTTLGAATTAVIRDGVGGAVLWRVALGVAAGSMSPSSFTIPKCGAAANTLLEFALETAVTGTVYVNANGPSRQ
jgi:hypothetical protein